jgi:tetratricopeptide (TPR) repeat protein
MSRDYQPDLRKLPALIKVLTDNDVAVMPDLSFTFTNILMWDSLENVWSDPEFAYLQPETASMWLGGNINQRDNLDNFIVREQWKLGLIQKLTIEFQKAGILQVIGTDASLPGLFPGEAVHRELTELVKAGISNYDALAIGTRNAGEFIQRYIDRDTRVGQIQPGYRADFVILNANPLQDIRNARAVDAVVVNGVYTGKSQLNERRAQQRARYEDLNNINRDVDTALLSDDADKLIHDLLQIHRDDVEVFKSIEGRINAAGYAAAFADDLDRSQRILELNTRLFPHSANTWDSLAELVLYRGDKDRALQLYRKALDADPTFRNAADNIERILENAGR